MIDKKEGENQESFTKRQYFEAVSKCKTVFLKKNSDYGPSWTILRMPSITDQLYIKGERIRTLEETGINKVGEDIFGEFLALVNYCVMALILLDHSDLGSKEKKGIFDQKDRLEQDYNSKIEESYSIMVRKNHDYGEAWRNMRVGSFTDLILMKIMRLKQIEDNDGKTIISEGPDANYVDILNYSIFALIKLSEKDE